MAPIVDGLEVLYGDFVNFSVIDIDDPANEDFMEALGYSPRIRPGMYIIAPDGTTQTLWIGVVEGRLIQEELVKIINNFQ
jgi:hypothetical protein